MALARTFLGIGSHPYIRIRFLLETDECGSQTPTKLEHGSLCQRSSGSDAGDM
jgi:hypothetical protein